MDEAIITIDGHTLTRGQSTCVRVAIITFLIALKEKEFAEGLGQNAIYYHAHMTEIMKMLNGEVS